MYRIGCAEIWGGIRGAKVEAETSGVRACLFSCACEGEEGGDVYYFSVCANDLITRIALADVMGHGESVANTSRWLYDSLRQRMDSLDGNEVLADLNRLAIDYGYEAMTTAAVVAYYREGSDLMFSYAGHHPALVHHRAAGVWTLAALPEESRPANLPLGVDAAVPYDQAMLPLSTGDRVFIYTDGLIEARDASGRVFGEERLHRVLNELDAPDAASTIEGVLAALNEFTNGRLNHDDVTFIAAEIR
jgi:sigma-B regulation protein RsbU (phosphoserine phosphatase)